MARREKEAQITTAGWTYDGHPVRGVTVEPLDEGMGSIIFVDSNGNKHYAGDVAVRAKRTSPLGKYELVFVTSTIDNDPVLSRLNGKADTVVETRVSLDRPQRSGRAALTHGAAEYVANHLNPQFSRRLRPTTQR